MPAVAFVTQADYLTCCLQDDLLRKKSIEMRWKNCGDCPKIP
jgi:hypothetical protein